MSKFEQTDYDDANAFLSSRRDLFKRVDEQPVKKAKSKELKPLSEQALFMLEYLKSNKCCSSWDFPADHAFAQRFGTIDEINLIADSMNSNAPFGFILSAWSGNWKKTVTEKRLKALRELVAHKHVKASWTGLGEGAMNQWGTTRTRSYTLIS